MQAFVDQKMGDMNSRPLAWESDEQIGLKKDDAPVGRRDLLRR